MRRRSETLNTGVSRGIPLCHKGATVNIDNIATSCDAERDSTTQLKSLEGCVHGPGDRPEQGTSMTAADWERVRFALEEMRAQLIEDTGESGEGFAQSVAILIERLGNFPVACRDQAAVYSSSASSLHRERGAAWLAANRMSSV